MLLLILISILMLLITLWLHCYQHFELNICTKNPLQSTDADNVENIGNTTRTKQHTRKHGNKHVSYLCSLLRAKDDEKYDFFPTSFLYYIIFEVCICLLITSRNIMDYYYKHHQIDSHIFFDYSLQIQQHKYPQFIRFHSVHLSDTTTLPTRDIFVRISDYIFIYGMMLLLIWESLFSFYRYFTTIKIIRRYDTETSQKMLYNFVIYTFVFVLVFNIQIHCYYYLCPVVLMVYFVFNIICSRKFSSLLIKTYTTFMDLGDSSEITINENENILHTVYLMRRLSIICIISQSICLSLFIFSYTVNTIYYLPILWSLSSFIYALNFVRSRRYLSYKLFQLKQKVKYLKLCIDCYRIKNVSENRPKPHKPSKPIEMSIDVKVAESTVKFSDVKISDTRSSTVSADVCAFSDINIPPSQPQISGSKPIYSHRSVRTLTSNKAFILLGISAGNSMKILPDLPPRQGIVVQSKSDNILTPKSSGERGNGPKPMYPRQITYSNSDITYRNHMETKPVDIPTDIEDNEESETISYVPKLPLRRISSPRIPVEHVVSKLKPLTLNAVYNTDVIKHYINTDNIDAIKDEAEDEEDEDECVFVEYNPNLKTLEEMPEYDESEEDSVQLDIIVHNDNRMKPPLQLQHHRSNSDPIGIRNEALHNLNIHEVMGSLNLFAKYGFCSRNSINSLYQLTRYRNKITEMHFQITK